MIYEYIPILVDRVLDTLTVVTESLAFLPAHLLEHLEAYVLHGQLELFVVGEVGISSLLQRLETNI